MRKIILFIGIILLSASMAKEKYPPIEIPEELQQFIEPDTVPIIFETIPMDNNEEAKLLVLKSTLDEVWVFSENSERTLLILQKNTNKQWDIAAKNNKKLIICSECNGGGHLWIRYNTLTLQKTKFI